MKPHTFVRLCRARDLLRESCASGIPLPRIAGEAGMSTFHFVRRFSALFGETPHQYRLQARLHRARELLARGEHSVTETCFETGFSSLGSFSTWFTREVGVTPGRFQRAARVSVASAGTLHPHFFPGCLSLLSLLPADAFRNFQEVAVERSVYDGENTARETGCASSSPA